jgi:hypothetical protein
MIQKSFRIILKSPTEIIDFFLRFLKVYLTSLGSIKALFNGLFVNQNFRLGDGRGVGSTLIYYATLNYGLVVDIITRLIQK